MKILLTTCLLLIGLVAFCSKLDAGQCAGGPPVYWCSASDFAAIINDADTNCCAGSAIHLWNPCTETLYIHDVDEHGPSSSCAIPE